MLDFRYGFQRLIQLSPYTHSSFIFLQIDAYLCCPCVSCPSYKCTGIGIAKRLIPLTYNKIGISFQRVLDSLKFFNFRNLIFKGNCRLFHIRRINFQQLPCILYSGGPNLNLFCLRAAFCRPFLILHTFLPC